MVDQEISHLIDCLAANNCPIPEPGYEWMGETEEIIASAELAWVETKLAVLREDEIGYQLLFESAGWRVFLLAEVMTNPEQFCSMLNQVIGAE